ncbi:MAG: carboxypeptidase regulatory-like domain-containing protein [Candidatus Rokubacteria bacterium]|nr:carboxypeptidase regulatory-like domain-containing protein [Candidatus Rokubacteria bacterium]
MPKPSLSSVQAVVGLLAGMISITGGVYSFSRAFQPNPKLGEVVAVVREAKTDKPVQGATIEILARDGALVATLVAGHDGRARQSLKEGLYRLRVSHPRFGAEVRQVQALSGQRAEIRIQLAQKVGGSLPIGEATRAVNEGVSAVRRFFQGLGL